MEVFCEYNDIERFAHVKPISNHVGWVRTGFARSRSRGHRRHRMRSVPGKDAESNLVVLEIGKEDERIPTRSPRSERGLVRVRASLHGLYANGMRHAFRISNRYLQGGNRRFDSEAGERVDVSEEAGPGRGDAFRLSGFSTKMFLDEEHEDPSGHPFHP